MFTLKALPFLLMISVVKCDVEFETMCKDDYRDINNTQIDMIKYCSHNLCIEKCCSAGEILNPKSSCMNAKIFFDKFQRVKHLYSEINYSKITLSSWDGNSIKKSKKNFVFVQNHRDFNNCTSELMTSNVYYILEDGSIKMQDTEASKTWFDIDRLAYCIDFKLTVVNNKLVVIVVVRGHHADPEDVEQKWAFVLVGLLVSSFFLLLVLVVYCLLPRLRNLIGLALMAYVLSILVAFIVKIIIHLTINEVTASHCKCILSPALYFSALSSFFWLNVMSFDVWWSLRGFRKRRDINRRGELVKFMWYCLYAWGAPALMTVIVITLDNIDLSYLAYVVKPPFDDCFVNDKGISVYLMRPVGVIISVNIVLFFMTAYNIWIIKRAVHNSQDSKTSKQQTNRFVTYMKLSVIMGVSWCLELIPPERKLWPFILTTTYNLFIGVAIFFLFVFNKRILVMICKRFNIQNDFIKKFELSQRSRSGTTRTTRDLTVTNNFNNRDLELNMLKNYPKGERVDD